jgi:hypothetical protein
MAVIEQLNISPTTWSTQWRVPEVWLHGNEKNHWLISSMYVRPEKFDPRTNEVHPPAVRAIVRHQEFGRQIIVDFVDLVAVVS